MRHLANFMMALAVIFAPAIGYAATAQTPVVLDSTGRPIQATAVMTVDTTGAYVAGGGGGGGGASTIADAADVTQGALADAACATDNGTCTAQALAKRTNQRLTTLNSTLGSPFQAGGSIGNTAFGVSAGEAHVGEVGANQFTITVAQTVTASSAYASGNAVGGLLTFANAARVSGSAGAPGTSGMVQSVLENTKSAQTSASDLVVFSANPSGSTCTDKTAFSVAAADFDKIVGIVHITDWTSLGTPSAGQAQNQAMPYALSSATSLYGCLVTRGTPTFSATTDVSLTVRVVRN